MSVQFSNNPELTDTIKEIEGAGGSFADSPAVNNDIYQNFDSGANIFWDNKKGLVTDGRANSDSLYTTENDKDGNTIPKCNAAFLGAAMGQLPLDDILQTNTLIVNLGALGEVKLRSNVSTPEEAEAVRNSLEQAAEHNPERLQEVMQYTHRDSEGRIPSTNADNEHAQNTESGFCGPQLSASQAADLANGIENPDAQDQLGYMQDIEQTHQSPTIFAQP